MKTLRLAGPVAAVLLVLIACDAQLNMRDIPDPYKGKIVSLHNDMTSLNRKCADLQKQIAEMNAQMNWDATQIEITSAEAMNSLRYSNVEYKVDVQKLKIVGVKTK